MNEVRLMASHPDYKKFKRKQQQLCWITNPHMLFGIKEDNDGLTRAGIEEDDDNLPRVDIPKLEMKAIKRMIEDDIEKMIDNYQFLPAHIAEAINKREEENSGGFTKQDLLDMGFQKEE